MVVNTRLGIAEVPVPGLDIGTAVGGTQIGVIDRFAVAGLFIAEIGYGVGGNIYEFGDAVLATQCIGYGQYHGKGGGIGVEV